MNRIFTICLALAGMIAATNSVNAGINWDYNFSGASGGLVPNLTGVNEAQFLAGSFLGFNDNDGSGGISKGDTFRDYTIIRVRAFTDQGGNDITPLTYGSGPGRDHEITVKLIFSGVQTSANTYAVTDIELAEFYFDNNADGAFTGSNFFDPDGTFFDGSGTPGSAIVETATLGGKSGGTNTGPTAPDGTIDIIANLTDALHTQLGFENEYFELDTLTGLPLDTILPSVFLKGVFDANNLVSPPATPLGGIQTGSTINGILVTSGYDAVFAAQGLTGTQVGGAGAASAVVTSMSDAINGAYDFAFHTRSDGSFVKDVAVVPEPASIAIWSLGVFGIAGVRRRRRQAAKIVA